MMGSKFKINETLAQNLGLLALGAGCALAGPDAVLGYSIFAAPTLGIGTWSAAKFLTQWRKTDPKNAKAIKRIQTEINSQLSTNAKLAHINRSGLAEIDKALAPILAQYWPSPKTIIELSQKPNGHINAISKYVLNKMDDSIFNSKLVKSNHARNYASVVIEAALEAALTDKQYFDALQPEILMKTLELSGDILREVETLATRLQKVDVLGEAIVRMASDLKDIKATVDELRMNQKTLEEKEIELKEMRGDNTALRQDIVRYRKDISQLTIQIEALLTENLDLERKTQNIPRSDYDESIVQTLTSVVINPETVAEKAAADYLTLDIPDLRSAISALEKNIAAAESQYEQEVVNAKQKLIKKHTEIAAAAYYVDARKAISAFERILELSPKNGEIWNDLGMTQFRIGETNSSRYSFQRTLDIGVETSNLPLQAIALLQLGSVEIRIGATDNASRHYRRALLLNQKLGRRSGEARCHGNLAMIALSQGNIDEAEIDLKKALEIFIEYENQAEVALTLNKLGDLEKARGNFSAATSFHNQSLKINSEIGNDAGIEENYRSLGNIAHYKEDVPTAQKYFTLALEAAKQCNHKMGMAISFAMLGNLAQMRGELSLAEKLLKEALAMHTEINDKSGIAADLGNIGVVKLSQNEHSSALNYFQKSLDNYTETSNMLGVGITMINIAKVKKLKGDVESALSDMMDAKHIFAKIDANHHIRIVDEIISETTKGN